MSTDPREQALDCVPSPKRVRVVFNGLTVADSTRTQLLREARRPPGYYFPPDDVRQDLLVPGDRRSHCPLKGEACYWHVQVGDRLAGDGAWSHPRPEAPGAAPLAGLIAFAWNDMDAWYEEDEQVFVGPRDPYTRIDIRQSARAVKVLLRGQALADTRRARFLFETGLPTAFYIPREDVRMDLLEPSTTRSGCPYKGEAHYFSAQLEGERVEDVAWTYPQPYPEALPVKDYLAFYPGRVDAIYLDGEPVSH